MTIVKRSIDCATARRAVAAAVAKSVEMNKSMSIAVVDDAGLLKAFERMDNASQVSIDIAQNKAFTSAATRLPTHEWHEFIKNDPPLLHGIVHTPRLIIFGGGLPITEGGQVIGAIGVSGGHYSDDIEVAKAALAAIGAPVA